MNSVCERNMGGGGGDEWNRNYKCSHGMTPNPHSPIQCATARGWSQAGRQFSVVLLQSVSERSDQLTGVYYLQTEHGVCPEVCQSYATINMLTFACSKDTISTSSHICITWCLNKQRKTFFCLTISSEHYFLSFRDSVVKNFCKKETFPMLHLFIGMSENLRFHNCLL